MVGILVHGDNHFIVRGPLPDRDVALALVRHWSLIQIGATTPPALDRWYIVSREFRENLRWAVVVPGDREISPAVTKLLDELSAAGNHHPRLTVRELVEQYRRLSSKGFWEIDAAADAFISLAMRTRRNLWAGPSAQSAVCRRLPRARPLS